MTRLLPAEPDVPVFAGLAFVAEWSLFTRPFFIDGVWIGWPKALRKFVETTGPLSPELVEETARRIAGALPPA